MLHKRIHISRSVGFFLKGVLYSLKKNSSPDICSGRGGDTTKLWLRCPSVPLPPVILVSYPSPISTPRNYAGEADLFYFLRQVPNRY